MPKTRALIGKSSARPTTPVRWKMSRVAARGFQRPQRYNAPSFMGQITRGPMYFEHLGAGPSLDAVSAARGAGCPVYGETCPHYLCFSEEIYRTPRGVEFLKSPPLRRREDCESLWDGIAHGSISSVATDESLALIVEK